VGSGVAITSVGEGKDVGVEDDVVDVTEGVTVGVGIDVPPWQAVIHAKMQIKAIANLRKLY